MFKKIVLLIMCFAIFSVCGCSKEGADFEKRLANVDDANKIDLKEYTDFEWDTVYFVAPYASKEEIEESLSIKADEIEDNYSVDEGGLCLIFVKGKVVVYTLIGNPQELGFDFDVGKYETVKKISSKKSIFTVSNDEDMIRYTLMEP